MSTINQSGFTEATAQEYRGQFPGLNRIENDQPVVFFDGPAGTQVPQRVADEMSRYLLHLNANHGGLFGTSIESDQLLHEAHKAFADFVGGSCPEEIVFGQNMTSLTFAISRAISQTWEEGDEIIVTALDHDANVSPWVMAARDAKAKVNFVPFKETDYTLDLEKFQSLLNDRTRMVAVGCASNATGGINPVKQMVAMAKQVGALTYLDAVHYGPHGLIDVQDWGCDFLACSAYKFFGPHLGTVWGKTEHWNSLEAYRVRPAGEALPGKWMTGTQSHESIAGGLACVDYLADLGRAMTGQADLSRRPALIAAFENIVQYEQALSKQMISGLKEIEGIKIWGIEDLERLAERFPTFSITHPSIKTTELAKRLAAEGIYVWNGHYYALEFTERLGLEPEGMVRIGMVHYNTPSEVDRLLGSLRKIVS